MRRSPRPARSSVGDSGRHRGRNRAIVRRTNRVTANGEYFMSSVSTRSKRHTRARACQSCQPVPSQCQVSAKSVPSQCQVSAKSVPNALPSPEFDTWHGATRCRARSMTASEEREAMTKVRRFNLITGTGRDRKDSAIGSNAGLRKAAGECVEAARRVYYDDDPRLRIALAKAVRHLTAHLEACRDRM